MSHDGPIERATYCAEWEETSTRYWRISVPQSSMPPKASKRALWPRQN